MLIRSGEDYVELIPTDRVSDQLPTPGNTRLNVTICSSGFRGSGSTWVDSTRLAAFLDELRVLDRQRRGVAELESISPGEFQLRIQSVDRKGHLAVGGRLVQRVHGGDAGPHQHLVEFGFEFDPSILPHVLAGFKEIAGGHFNH